MANCVCGSDYGNTGLTTCSLVAKVAERLFAWPTINGDVERNRFQASDFDANGKITQLALDTYVKHPDITKRLLPLAPNMKNVNETKNDDTTESFDDGDTAVTQEGAQIFEGIMPNIEPAYLGKLKSLGCTDMSIIAVDGDNTVIGQDLIGDLEELYPIDINMDTWSPKFIKATASSIARIQLNFEYGRTNQDENIVYAPSDANFKTINGLIDVNPGITVSSVTEIIVDAKTCFGQVQNPTRARGLNDLTDWEVTDVNGAILAISVVDDVLLNGVYTITHADSTGVIPITVSNGSTTLSKGFFIKSTVAP